MGGDGRLSRLRAARSALASAEERTGLRSAGGPLAARAREGLIGDPPPGPWLGVGAATGGAVVLAGSTSALLALLAHRQGAQGWCAVVGGEDLGWCAAAHLGLALDRVLAVPIGAGDGGEARAAREELAPAGILAVTAALLDGVDALLITARPASRLRSRDRATLTARARDRGALILSPIPWEGARVLRAEPRGALVPCAPPPGARRRCPPDTSMPCPGACSTTPAASASTCAWEAPAWSSWISRGPAGGERPCPGARRPRHARRPHCPQGERMSPPIAPSSSPAHAAPRLLAVWVPDWPVVALTLQGRDQPRTRRGAGEPPPDPATGPVAVIGARGVVAASPAARAAGVGVGMRLRLARSLCPGLAIIPPCPEREARAFEGVMEALGTVLADPSVMRPGLALSGARGPPPGPGERSPSPRPSSRPSPRGSVSSARSASPTPSSGPSSPPGAASSSPPEPPPPSCPPGRWNPL
ncbi:hypothetical protein ADENT20671_0791 [Actinomyces denticolens]|uniref:Y-family DNA polymerase n=1 Tax=Actinomyces denticolens TaxID=52767 RepID=UPI0009CBD8EC|nr:hypothetical protein [Actinomyces denticolens]GAV94023.1 hypothetical protein ADENT20671_0791 [Actinomyces denticolens]